MSGVQSLDRDPEIEFTDALVSRDADKDKPVEDANGLPWAAARPCEIAIESPEPMWIRRDDFAVQMSAKLKIVVGNGPPGHDRHDRSRPRLHQPARHQLRHQTR